MKRSAPVLPPTVHSWLTAAAPVPPLLLSATDEATLTQTADYLIQVLACSANQMTPCGTCTGCRLATAGNHPDVIKLSRQTPTWTIKDMRRLLDQLSRTALGAWRVVILPEAERLSLPAANALLKSLEEPGRATRYVLTTRWPGRLLPTIRSRCQPVRLAGAATAAAAEAWWPAALAQRIAAAPAPLTAQQLAEAAAVLRQRLQETGPTPELKRAYQRLRDYHVIVSKQGNEKLAREVLMLSLPSVRNG